MATAIVQSGDYLLEMATGDLTNQFILNTSTLNGTNVLDGENEFADITAFTDTINYTRGRRKTTDQQNQAGQLSFQMIDNVASGNLNPLYTSSTYYDNVNNEPGLAPLRKIRLSRSGVYLFVGVVASYNYQYNLGGLNLVSVHCNDDQIKLAQTILPSTVVSAETAGSRVTTILANAAVNYTGSTSIATSTSTLAAATIPADTVVSTYFQEIIDAEQGRLFFSKSGVLTFQGRIGTTLAPASATFSDAGSIPYDGITIEYDQNNVVNKATVTLPAGTPQVANDTASQSLYFIQAVTYSNSLLSTDAQAATLATYLLAPTPEPRYTSVSTTFAMLTDAQRTTIAALEIGDTIQVTKAMLVGGSITQTLTIEGIDAVITLDRGHQVTLYTSAVVVYNTFILNDLEYGTLTTTNALS